MPDKSVLAPYRSKLGKIPDQQIADLANVSRTLVVNYRKKLGIAPYQGYRAAPAPSRVESSDSRPFRGRRSALDAYTDRLGKIPDAEIARLAGVTAENVRTYRRRRDIPAAWQTDEIVTPPAEASPPAPATRASRGASKAASAEPPARAKAPAAPEPSATPVHPATAESGTAYVVTVDTEEGPRTYALVAADIAAAALDASTRVSSRHPGASIRSIQRVADVFPT